ncbi:MAG: hypothetical protein K2M82_01390 [Lachnospiraceae bacterium]|nr:hypothetical protein [Lachnospiraceae bacterium]
MNSFEKAKNFIYRNARPVDLARWKFHFENGSIDDVVHAISFYQNDDGGFAYAIEPDNWNINSTPISTWAATTILREIGFADSSHPIIKNILKYLDSGKDFSDGKWYNVVASNNDYPHAVWWGCDKDGKPDDNPTVSLSGFVLKFADKESSLYNRAANIAAHSVKKFVKAPCSESHTLRCYAELLSYCEEIENFDLFDIEMFRQILSEQINRTICSEPEKWFKEYVCKPSYFYEFNNIIHNGISMDILEKEAVEIVKNQSPDGSFPVTWMWYNDYKEFEIAANWWKSDIIIKNMIILRDFGKI